MSSNPLITSKAFEQNSKELLNDKTFTIQGTISKIQISLIVILLAGCYTWNMLAHGFSDKAHMLTLASAIAGFILALFTAFKPANAKLTTIPYAICEGLFLGSISFAYQALFNGVVVKAVGLTFLALFSMLFLYKSGMIKATDKFKKVIIISTISIAVFYLIALLGTFLGFRFTLFDGGIIGIGVSFAICAVAALNFIIDFDFIEKAKENELPSDFEWYGAFTLLVTLIWLYIEVLRLLSLLSNRD